MLKRFLKFDISHGWEAALHLANDAHQNTLFSEFWKSNVQFPKDSRLYLIYIYMTYTSGGEHKHVVWNIPVGLHIIMNSESAIMDFHHVACNLFALLPQFAV